MASAGVVAPALDIRTFQGGPNVANRTCTIEGCGNPHLARGWCRKHYLQWYKNRGNAAVQVHLPFPDNLLARLEPQPNGCIWYTGHLNAHGYGDVWRSGQVMAHVAAWELEKGPKPEGLTLDHLCHNEDPTCVGGDSCSHRRCCNLAHLALRTMKDNTLASPNTITGINARKTRCPQGHPYDEVNTYVPPSGGRNCRICVLDAKRRWRKRQSGGATIPKTAR